MNNVIVTTTDFKQEYDIIGTAVYQYPRFMGSGLTDLTDSINQLSEEGKIPTGMKEDGIIFLAAVEELKKQAVSLNGNGLIGLNAVYAKKDVLGNSNDFLILYATIVKIK